MTEIFLIATAAWIACGTLNYGMTLAYFQREFKLIAHEKFHADRRFALKASLFGPIALFVALLFTECAKHGFLWKNPHAD